MRSKLIIILSIIIIIFAWWEGARVEIVGIMAWQRAGMKSCGLALHVAECGMRNVECAVATKRRGVEAEAVSTKSSKLGTGRAKRNWNLPELRETGRKKGTGRDTGRTHPVVDVSITVRVHMKNSLDHSLDQKQKQKTDLFATVLCHGRKTGSNVHHRKEVNNTKVNSNNVNNNNNNEDDDNNDNNGHNK